MNAALTAFTPRGRDLAQRLTQALEGAGHSVSLRAGEPLAQWTQKAFAQKEALIFVGAAAIAVRAIAPYLRHKSVDPAVLVLDEGGQFVIPILSGHMGGANDLAQQVAALLGATAVITTGTDVNGIFAADQWARRQGFTVGDFSRIAPFSSALLAGERRGFWSRWPVEGTMPQELYPAPREEAHLVLDWAPPRPNALWLRPARPFVRLGVGCRRGASPEAIRALTEKLLADAGLDFSQVSAVCSIDLKQDEPGLLAFCRELGLPLTVYTAQELAAVPGDFPPSPFVQQVTGVDNVCQRAALAGGGLLIRAKTAREGVTAALAAEPLHFDWRNCL